MAELSVVIDSRGARSGGSEVERTLRSMDRTAGTTVSKFKQMGRSIGNSFDGVKSRIFNLQTAIVGLSGAYGLGRLANSALDTASSFEMMEVKLDALTKGKGKETLDEINAWALDMPVNTKKAVDSFTMMMAMGLDPTIEKMQILVDTASIFGEDTMPRVARALGQMATLGKLSAEELNQLSEAGINARKYLGDFGMTLEQLQKAVAEGEVPITAVIDAIWEGLNKDYGGAAAKAQDAWTGLVMSFKSYITEIQRVVMGAGVFDALKGHLKTVNKHLKEWLENNKELIKQKIPEYIETIETKVKALWTFLSGISKETYAAVAGGLFGGFLFGGKGALILGTLAAIDVKTEGLLSKKWNTEMTIGLVGGLLFGGKIGLVVGGLAMIDGFLGGPMLSASKDLIKTTIEYGKKVVEVWGPKLDETLEEAINKWNKFEIECELIFMRLTDGINESSTNHIGTLESFILDTYGVLKEATEVFLSLVDPPIQATSDLIIELGKLGILLIKQDIERLKDALAELGRCMENLLLPVWEDLKKAVSWVGNNLGGIINNITKGITKLREFLTLSDSADININKMNKKLEEMPDLVTIFPTEASLNIKITGSGSTTLPISEKIAEIKRGLNSLSGQGAYHVRIKHPSISDAPQMAPSSLLAGGTSYEDIKKSIEIIGKSLMKDWREDRRLISDYISRNAMRTPGYFEHSDALRAASMPYRRRAEYRKGTDELYYAQAMAPEDTSAFLSKLVEQYEAIKKGIAMSADIKLKEYRADRRLILDYQNRTPGFDIGETTRALFSPGRRHKKYLEEADVKFLEPLRKQIEEYNNNLRKEFRLSSLDLSRYSTETLAQLQKIGEFYRDYQFPAGPQVTLIHKPESGPFTSYLGKTPESGPFSSSYLGKRPGSGPFSSSYLGKGIPQPIGNVPSVIINTGDLHVKAAADDPSAVKVIDEKLAELIRSGRSLIPAVFKSISL